MITIYWKKIVHKCQEKKKKRLLFFYLNEKGKIKRNVKSYSLNKMFTF